MAKDIVFGEPSRQAVLRGVDIRRQCGEGHARPQGSQCRPRQKVRLPPYYQGWRYGRQGDRSREDSLNMGAQMVREVASKTSDIAGDEHDDGDRAQAIVREGCKSVAAGMNPMDLKRGVDMAVAAIVEDVKKRSKKVSTSDEISRVGTISANGEREIGEMIAASHGQSRQGRGDHGRGSEVACHRARGGRGHAIRPRLSLRPTSSPTPRRCSAELENPLTSSSARKEAVRATGVAAGAGGRSYSPAGGRC